MPKKRFALEKGREKRLEVSWQLGWKGVTMKLDGAEVGAIKGKDDLKLGKNVVLPDGSSLSVRLVRQGLELVRDGEPLPGSATDPEQAVMVAVVAVFWIGGGNLLLGTLSALDVLDVVYAWASIAIGFVFLGLGFFVRRKSAVALGAAIVLTMGLALWALRWFIVVFAAGGVPYGIGGFALTVAFLVLMIRGYQAIAKIEARRGANDS